MLKPGDGVMVETSYNNWDWGKIVAVHVTGYLVEIWDKAGNHQRLCPKDTVYPDDYSWEDTVAAIEPPSTAVTIYNYTAPAYKELPDDEMYLFTYGTLKKGGRLHKALDGCEFIGKDLTRFKKYKMFSCGDRFPAITEWKGNCAIQGEIYKINPQLLKRLDDIEGVPHLYRRDKCFAETFEKECYIYIGSFKLENTYGNEFGTHIFYDDTTKSHVWEN